MTGKESVGIFWEWFRRAEVEISKNYHDPAIMRKIDRYVHQISPDLSWEIGPVGNEGLYFSLSPDLDDELMELASESVARSYKSEIWIFLVGRQRRPWNDLLTILNEEIGVAITFDLSKWTHVAYRDKDEGLIDIVFSANCSSSDDEDMSRMANIAAVGLLGEILVMERVGSIEVRNFFERKLEAVAKPIYWLPYAFGMKPME